MVISARLAMYTNRVICTKLQSNITLKVCEHVKTVAKGGGQNRKAQKRRGRLAGFSPTDAIAHIGQLVETRPPFVHPSDTAVYTSDGTESFECVLCSNVLIQPVELDSPTWCVLLAAASGWRFRERYVKLPNIYSILTM